MMTKNKKNNRQNRFMIKITSVYWWSKNKEAFFVFKYSERDEELVKPKIYSQMLRLHLHPKKFYS